MDNKEVFTFTGGPPPNWLERYSWYAPVQVSPADTMPMVGLKKLVLQMSMCCIKCAEIISEKLREVPGVMDVQVFLTEKKVIVIGAPFAADVLKRAKRIDRKAQWWPAPLPAPASKDEKKTKEETKTETTTTIETKTETTTETKTETKKETEKDETKDENKDGKKEKEGDNQGGGGGGKPKVEEPKLQQYPPFEYNVLQRYPSFDYHPSQAYNPLLPYNPYPYGRQVFYDWPHFRTAEGAEATFVPPPKPVPYQSVADLWNIFQPP